MLHGLRKTAAARLAEAGCTEQEIMAVTGHVTSRMVTKYTKDASKKKQATRGDPKAGEPKVNAECQMPIRRSAKRSEGAVEISNQIMAVPTGVEPVFQD